MSDTAVGGQSVHSEVIFATDGKDYAITTNPAPPPGTSITQSFEKAGATSYKTSVKVAGQVLATTVSEISADGKTKTLLTAAGASASMSTTLVFNRK